MQKDQSFSCILFFLARKTRYTRRQSKSTNTKCFDPRSPESSCATHTSRLSFITISKTSRSISKTTTGSLWTSTDAVRSTCARQNKWYTLTRCRRETVSNINLYSNYLKSKFINVLIFICIFFFSFCCFV